MAKKIEYLNPLFNASDRTYNVLFKDFGFGKYIVLSICLLLSQLQLAWWAEHIIMYAFPSQSLEQLIPPISEITIDTFITIFFDLMTAYSGTMCIMVIIYIVQYFVFAFFRARGNFMMVDNLLKNSGSIKGSWKEYGSQANSLTIWYTVLFVAFIASFCFIVATSAHFSYEWAKQMFEIKSFIVPDSKAVLGMVIFLTGFFFLMLISKCITICI
jgi:hypothetical protein